MSNEIKQPLQTLDITKGVFDGANIINSTKTIGQLPGMFLDEDARQQMDQQQQVYSVQAHLPVADGTTGGLFMGTTWIKPGTVGNEYFMTHGHFHQLADRGEYYWGLEGNGILLLMDEQRNTRAVHMYPGSLHYIPAYTAHRVVNVGDTELSFGACWPSDAGHNYDEIKQHGFSKRVISQNGVAILIDA
jgi:glucose-6-phosphate isomerase, archaeal